MQKAADIAVDDHNHGMKFAEVGQFEYQIQAKMEYIRTYA